MPRQTWLTAAGVGGAIVIAGSALVAVAATGPADPGPTSTSPSASGTSTPEGTPESGVSTTPSRSSTPESSPSASPGDLPARAGAGQPAVSADDAVEIARAALGRGDALAVEEIDLELEDGRQIWDVEFVGDHEVEVDSTTGDVVKLEFGDGRDDDSGHGRGGHDDGPNHD